MVRLRSSVNSSEGSDMRDDWSSRSISDCLAEQFPGEWGSAPSGGGNATVLRSTDIDDAGHVELTSGARRTIASSKLAQKRLRAGDVLLESSGGGPGKPVGRVALFRGAPEGAFLCSNFFRTLRPKTGVDGRFLAWRLQQFYAQPRIWVFQQQTTGIINLRFRDYAAAELSWPPPPEQRGIAEILDTVDEAIRKTEEIIAKLKQVKQGLLHDLLTRGIDDNGELRDPDRHPEQFKDTSLGRIPKEWQVVELADGATVTVGYVGPTNPYYTDREAGVLFLRTGNITAHGIDLRDVRWVTPAFHGSQPKSQLIRGDVVVSRVGYTGTAAVVPELGEVNCANMVVIRVGTNLTPEWVRRLFEASTYIRQVSGFTAGSAQPVLNVRLVERLVTPVPAIREQLAITDRLGMYERRLGGEQAELGKLRLLKQGLMDDLLTGRVRVTALLSETKG